MKEHVFSLVEEFCKEPHGRTDYDKDEVYVMGSTRQVYAPFSFLQKSMEGLVGPELLLESGFVYNSYGLVDDDSFDVWYETQFSKKITLKTSNRISILHWPDHKAIFDAIAGVNRFYEELRKHMILINGKNLPAQLGEWFAKVIFGLRQVKSTSQRGFDFYIGDRMVEVLTHWSDASSPKGVKLKKSLIELSDCCILMYMSRNLMVREICFLDSEFIMRKFTGKGHTIFLKDTDVAQYFFSKSAKHFDKVVNKNALMKFATPNLAMKLDGRLNESEGGSQS